MFSKAKKAFTIVELVIVIAVIAILMGIMFVGGTAISNNAKASTLESDLRTFETNIKAMVNAPDSDVQTPFAKDNAWFNVYFEDDMALAAFDADMKTNTGTTVKAIEATTTMNDPYGMPYRVVVLDNSTTNNTDISFIVFSYGRNKQTGDTTGTWDKDDVARIVRIYDSVLYTADIEAGDLNVDTEYQNAVNHAFAAELPASKGVQGDFDLPTA